MVQLTLSDPPGETTHWTAPAVARARSISVSSVQRIWRSHGLQPHRMRQFKLSNDPRFADKVRDFEVDDLVQQTWMAMIHARDRFAPTPHGDPEMEADAPSIASFRAYLYGTARMVLYGHFRQRTRAQQFDPGVSSLEDLAPSPSRQMSAYAKLERLGEALRKLPLDVQVLLELRYAHEMTSSEIATIHGIPRGTVKSRLRVAKQRLDAQLARMGLPPAPG